MDPSMYYYARYSMRGRANAPGYQTATGSSDMEQTQYQGYQYMETGGQESEQAYRYGSASQRPSYEELRAQHESERQLYESQRSQYESSRLQYDMSRPPYDYQRMPYDKQRQQYDAPRSQYDAQRAMYDSQKPHQDMERPQHDTQRPPTNTQRSLDLQKTEASNPQRSAQDAQKPQANMPRSQQMPQNERPQLGSQKVPFDLQRPPPDIPRMQPNPQRSQPEVQRSQAGGQRPQSLNQRGLLDSPRLQDTQSPHRDSPMQQHDGPSYKNGSKQDGGQTERQGGGLEKQAPSDQPFEKMQNSNTSERYEKSEKVEEGGYGSNYYDYGHMSQYDYGTHGMYDGYGYGYGYGYGDVDYYGSYDQNHDYGSYHSGGSGTENQDNRGKDQSNQYSNYHPLYKFGPKDLVHNFGTPPPPPPPPPVRAGGKDPTEASENQMARSGRMNNPPDGYGSPSVHGRFGKRDQDDNYEKANPPNRFGNNNDLPDYRKPPPNYYGNDSQSDGYGNAHNRYNSQNQDDDYGNSYPPNRYGNSDYRDDYRGSNSGPPSRFGNSEPMENSMANQMNRFGGGDSDYQDMYRKPPRQSLLGMAGMNQSNKMGNQQDYNNGPSSLLGMPHRSGQKSLFANPPPRLLDPPDGKQQPSLLGMPDANMFSKFANAMQKMGQHGSAGGLLEPPNTVNRGKCPEIPPPSSMAPCQEPERFNENPKKPSPKKPAEPLLPIKGNPTKAAPVQRNPPPSRTFLPPQYETKTSMMAAVPVQNNVRFDLLTGKMIGQKPVPFTKPAPRQPQPRFSRRAGLGLKTAINDGQIIKGMKGQRQFGKAAMKMGKNQMPMKMAGKQMPNLKGKQMRMPQRGQNPYNSMAFQNPWAKKGQLQATAPVTSQFGMKMMRKMGWTPGEGLGKNRKGTLVPLLVDVKTDRRGFHAKQESAPKKAAVPKLKEYEGKHPVSALIELCTRREWPAPEFKLVGDCGPDHKKTFLMKVVVNGHEFKPSGSFSSKKLAKAHAAAACLGRIKDLFPEPPPKPKTEEGESAEKMEVEAK